MGPAVDPGLKLPVFSSNSVAACFQFAAEHHASAIQTYQQGQKQHPKQPLRGFITVLNTFQLLTAFCRTISITTLVVRRLLQCLSITQTS